MIGTSAAKPLEYQIPFRCANAGLPKLDVGLQRQVIAAGADYHGAIFSGPIGTGKTFALVAAMREPNPKTFADCPLFVDWPEFIGDVDRWKALEITDRDRFDPVRRLCAWRGPLFVDDVGQEQFVESGYRRGESEALFDQFVNRRTGLDLALWITTNLSIADLRERYGERTSSRLSQHCLLIGICGDDRRLAAV
jgi:DNA replication protein DnaC